MSRPSLHQSINLKRVTLAALGFWTVFLTTSTLYLFARRDYPLAMLPFDLLLVAMGTGCSVAIAIALRRKSEIPFGSQLTRLAIMVLILSFPFELAFRAALLLFGGEQWAGEFTLRLLIVTSLFWIAPFGFWGAGVLAFENNSRARQRERQALQATQEAHEAQVRALRYQINPHFLYNTLNSVSSLIMDGRNTEADAMVLELAAFFRASLAVDPAKDVPLKEEIEHQLLYLGIEQTRFPDRVQVTVDVPAPLQQAGVPSFILQPLVENSMKYGMRGAGRKLHLRLAARAENDILLLEVADDGAGAADLPGTGTGLSNVERRLRTRYGERATLEARGGPHGFNVRLAMPLSLCA